MDKTITISGKPVTFRKTGGTVLRYKREFGRELNSDLAKIAALATIEESNKTALALGIETEWMYDIAFIMAQQADPSITDELAWLDSFEEFDPWAVFAQLMEMISKEQEIAPKNA